MGVFYSIFIISAVLGTFFVIFKKLTKVSYWTMGLIGTLYIVVLVISFFYDLP